MNMSPSRKTDGSVFWTHGVRCEQEEEQELVCNKYVGGIVVVAAGCWQYCIMDIHLEQQK